MKSAQWLVRLFVLDVQNSSKLTVYKTEREARAYAARLLGRKNLRGTRTWYDSHHDRFVFAIDNAARFVTFGQERPSP